MTICATGIGGLLHRTVWVYRKKRLKRKPTINININCLQHLQILEPNGLLAKEEEFHSLRNYLQL